MALFDTKTEETAQTVAESQDAQWLTLQRAVAAGMIVVLATPMVAVRQQLFPPLVVTGALFAVMLGLTWLRPRVAAGSIGVLAGLWLLLQFANLALVIPDLARPSATLPFMITLGMLVVPAAGLVGLIGVLRRASGRIAERTLQAGVTAMLCGLIVSLLAGL